MTTAAGAVASSRDGRTFRLEPGEGSTFFPGDVVVASTDTGDLVLGQVLTEPSVDDGSAAAGSGVVLGTLAPDATVTLTLVAMAGMVTLPLPLAKSLGVTALPSLVW